MTEPTWKDTSDSTTTPVNDTKRKEVVLPGVKSTDFIVDAKCRIMNIESKITIQASDLPGKSGGKFKWTTTSTKIKLSNIDTGTLTVESLKNPSAAKDAEEISVTHTAPDGSTATKTVKITVAKVTISASTKQRFGFDDFDTLTDHSDDHVCVKKSDNTLVTITVEGGATYSDFDYVIDVTKVCTAGSPSSVVTQSSSKQHFDLQINGGKNDKKSTVLRVKVKCPSAKVFAKITVHVYKEKVVKVVVAKVYDSKSTATTLNYDTADYAAHQTVANEKLKEAVVKYEISNYAKGNATTDINYDTDSNGALSFDINEDGGAEFKAIKDKIAVKSGVKVVIVKNMKSYYYLSKDAKKGDTSVTVKGSNVFTFSDPQPLGTGTTQENITVTSAAGAVATLGAPLVNDHSAGEAFEFPAAGWSSDPIIIIEGSASLDVAKWTVLHEVGHRALSLADVDDPTDFMHFEQSWTDYRLRFCPRTKKYGGGKENQWDTIPRT